MKWQALIITYIISSITSAQERAVLNFKYKRMNVPLVTSLDITNQFYFFSSDNLLWFSTKQGLTSYDGNEVVSYYPDTSQTIKYGLSSIRAMAEDKNNGLWIASLLPDFETSLSYFNRKTKILLKVGIKNAKEDFARKKIKGMFIDSLGLLWISTFEKAFYVYNTNDSTCKYFKIGELHPEEGRSIESGISMTPYLNDYNKMWLCTTDGIYLFNLESGKADLKYSFPGNDVYHNKIPFLVTYIDATTDSTLFIGFQFYGIGIYNVGSNSLSMFPPYAILKKGTPPYPVVQDGYLYLSLYSVAKKSTQEYYLYYIDSLPLIFNCVTQKYTQLYNPDLNKEIKKGLVKLLVDKKSNLWIGESKYLYVIGDEFSLFHSEESPDVVPLTKLNTLYSIVWSNENKSYYATFFLHKDIFEYDIGLNSIKKILTPFSAGSDYIKLLQDPDNNIWALYPGNLYRKSPGSICIYKKGFNAFKRIDEVYPQLNSLNRMTDMVSDGKNRLIFSNANGDLFFLDYRELKIDSISFPEIETSKQFNSIGMQLKYDSASKCVYVSNGRNIWQYNLEKKEGKLFVWDAKMAIAKNNNVFVTIDGYGRLWVLRKINSLNEIQIYSPETFEFKQKLTLNDLYTERSDRLQTLHAPAPFVFFMHDEGTTLYNYEDNSFRLFDKNNGLLYDFVRFTNFANNIYFSGHSNLIQYANFEKLKSLTNEKKPFINRVVVYEQKNILFPSFNNSRIKLDYKRNTIGISFSSIEYLFPERIQYAFRLIGLDDNWKYVDYKSREIVYSNLRPGKYTFQLKAQMLGGIWRQRPLELLIIITPPFWQTLWFRIIGSMVVLGLLYTLYNRRIKMIRKKEQLTAKHEKDLLELEAKALRAQMNPHFIFNSMNSIKSLINRSENEKAVNYLTTFSKLIRTLFNNCDKREVSLYEELETCRLYSQLEEMRFGQKLKFDFSVDNKVDLKDIKVPALILQPFIENAIWHGLMPKEGGGGVHVSVDEVNGSVECSIDDDGIGRELSEQYKADYKATHQSKGIGLTQSRLDLDRLLNEREGAIQIIDKKDDLGRSLGTKVIISFKGHLQ